LATTTIQKENVKRPSSSWRMFVGSICVVLVVAALYPTSPLRRLIHESFLARATSAHYELLFPPGALSSDSISQLIAQHEKLFAALDAKIGDVASTSTIRIIFENATSAVNGGPAYTVDGTTIRTFLNAQVPSLDPAADAEALLYAAWGKPGNVEVARWTAHWLVGEWQNQEIGMAAAGVEHSLGHTTVARLLGPQNSAMSAGDRTLLGAAWINEVAELGGLAQVRKLYSAKLADLDLATVSQTLGTTPVEVEREWQLWIFAYLAGIPSGPTSGMPPNMHMPHQP
jgi:hypothetical protein